MTPFLLLAAMVMAMLLVRVVLSGRRLQSSVAAFAGIHLVTGAAVLAAAYGSGFPDLWAVAVLWVGFALSLFGVRSHIESSILLWMVRTLRAGDRSANDLEAGYHAAYGHDARMAELASAGLIARTEGRWIVTPKGRGILGMRTWLIRRWGGACASGVRA